MPWFGQLLRVLVGAAAIFIASTIAAMLFVAVAYLLAGGFVD